MFDPYREWLGLADGPRPPDHYTLLGLAPSESDPAAISYAADMQAAKIRRIRPGENAADWGRLLDQLTKAKTCLLDPVSKAAYDATLASGTKKFAYFPTAAATPPLATPPLATPPLPQARAGVRILDSLPGDIPADPAPSDASPPAAPVIVSSPNDDPPFADFGEQTFSSSPGGAPTDAWGDPIFPLPTATAETASASSWPGGVGQVGIPVPAFPATSSAGPAPASRRSAAPIITFLLLVIAALGGSLAYVIMNPAILIALTSKDSASAGDAEKQPNTGSSPGDKNAGNPKKPKGNPPKRDNPASGAADSAVTPTAASPSNREPTEDPDVRGATPETRPQDDPPAEDKTRTDKPAQEPPTEPKTQADPAKREAFKKAVAEARLAMSQRDMPRAKKAAKAALANVQNQAEDDEAARTDALVQNLQEFWNNLARIISTLQPGTEVPYKDTRVLITEASRTGLAIKAGAMYRYKIEEIPTPLLTAISNELITQDAGWKMLMGTFLAMDAKGDRAAAKMLWQAAAKAGAPIDVLLPELGLAPSGKRAPVVASKGGEEAQDDSLAAFQAQIEAIQQRAKAAKGQRANGEVAKEALEQLEIAAKAGHWPEAEQLLEIVRTTSRKSENIALVKQAAMAAKQLQAMKGQ